MSVGGKMLGPEYLPRGAVAPTIGPTTIALGTVHDEAPSIGRMAVDVLRAAASYFPNGACC
jgi:hypothetical protein